MTSNEKLLAAKKLATAWNNHYYRGNESLFMFRHETVGGQWGVRQYNCEGESHVFWTIEGDESGTYASTATRMVCIDPILRSN